MLQTIQNAEKPVFIVSIDDGFVNVKYPLSIDGNNSIQGIYEKICKAFGTDIQEPIKKECTFEAGRLEKD